MTEKKRKCSGARCPMQHNTVNVGECKCTDDCPWYTPVPSFDRMELVLDMAAECFGMKRDKEREMLKIFFNAYLSQYIASCFPLGGGAL